MESNTSNRTKARMLVLSVFLIGLVAGALSMNLYQRMTSSGPDRGRERGRPEDHIIKKMNDKLDLNAGQQDRIKAILDETFTEYTEIRKEMEPRIKDLEQRIDTVRQQSRDRIRAELSAGQLPKYEEMVTENDRARQEWRDRQKKVPPAGGDHAPAPKQ